MRKEVTEGRSVFTSTSLPTATKKRIEMGKKGAKTGKNKIEREGRQRVFCPF